MTPQRRNIALSLATGAALALALTGCSSGGTSDAGFGECALVGEAGTIELTGLIEDNVLTVGTTLPSPAWWQGTSPETIDGGFEYCLAAELAHRAGLDGVVVNNISWDGLIAGQNNEFDIALAQVSITPDRQEAVDFSTPYYTSTVGVLTKTDSGITAENIADHQLGYQQGTTADVVVDLINPSADPRVFQDAEALVTAVQAGQIDVALQDSAIMIGFAQNSGGQLDVIGQYDTDERYGALYPSGSPNTSALDAALATLDEDGTLNALNDAWLAPAFGGNPADITVFE